MCSSNSRALSPGPTSRSTRSWVLQLKDDLVLTTGEVPEQPVPRYLVKPARPNPELLGRDIIVIDFGHTFQVKFPPPLMQEMRISLLYCVPEILFGTERPGLPADVWALACTLYEIHAGTQLFESFFGHRDEILRQAVQTLGKLPEPWWSSWDNRSRYFDEDGRPHAEWPDGIVLAVDYPLHAQLRDIGAEDESGCVDENMTCESILERPGTGLSAKEAADLQDLLSKMLRYRPEGRISMDKVLRHAWFRESKLDWTKFKEAIQAAWTALDQKVIDRLIHSIPRRIQAVKESDGLVYKVLVYIYSTASFVPN